MFLILKKIKWAYQRIIKRYNERIFGEFDSYFNQFIPAIQYFCTEELKEEYIHLNPKRKEIFTTTLQLIKNVKKEENNFYPDQPSISTSKFWEYFGKHIEYYWN